MVHIYGSVGQLGNQLFRFAHHIANAIALNYELVHHSFGYSRYYCSLEKLKIISLSASGIRTNKAIVKFSSVLFQNTLPRRVAQKCGYLIINEPLDYERTDIVKFREFASEKQVIAINWLFRDHINFNNYAQQLREVFVPNKEIVEQANKKIANIKTKYEIVIGVHIRRGDYISFENGSYYFSDSEYAQLMNHIKLLNSEKKIAFVLCSNEKIDMDSYTGLNCFYWFNHFMVDLTLLSCCDFLIGPPSTFSGWASFMGTVPLYCHAQKDAFPDMKDFKIVLG